MNNIPKQYREREVISFEFAKSIGLIENGYKSINAYSGNFLFESEKSAERRRKFASKEMEIAYENAKNMSNCVNKDLMLFEFDKKVIKEVVKRNNL